MKPRRAHRLLGVALLIPCLVWAVTGVLFHWKPGWNAAYASLPVKTYALEGAGPPADPSWLEVRRLQTVLGEHVLVRTEQGWSQWDVGAAAPRSEPGESDRRRLFEDAMRVDPERYGQIDSLEGWKVTTTTGVEVRLDWNTLRFNQSGADTRWIDRLYRIHYLQWTGTHWGDRILPLIGLFGLAALSLLGLRLILRR